MATNKGNTGPGVADRRFAAVGVFGGLAGMAVIDDADEAIERALATGAFDELPERLRWLEAVRRGETIKPDGLTEPNRSLLLGDRESLMNLSENADDPALAAHLRVAAFRLGAPVELPEPSALIDPRASAYLLATAAHDAAVEGDFARAVEMLREASAMTSSVSPAASARYCGEAAALVEGDATHASAPDAALLLDLESAAVRLDGLHYEELRGELLMTRARLLTAAGADRPVLLQEAIRCYQRATQALPRNTHPFAYAACHLNVAVAYLSMPMNHHASKLRAAIAAQSLREALEIFTLDEHPEYWASATLNLANALQHMPSSHVGDNLLEAVSLYETLLEHRREDGPERARVQANLGNALAHLGRLEEAGEALRSARIVFERLGDATSMSGIDGVLAEIKRVAAESVSGTERDA